MTLTKEWLQQTIAELEEERDATPGAVNEDAAMALEAMKLALASIEAEAVAFRSKLKPPSAIGSENWGYTDHRLPDAFELESCVIERLYTDPPAPVSVPAAYEHTEDFSEYHEGWNACRAAMPQGAEPVTTAYKLPFDQWLSQQTGTIDVECGCVMTELFFHWLRVAYEAGNSPVVLDGACPCCGRKQLKNRTCSISGCDGKHVAHGFCKKHYDIERKKDPPRRVSIRAADKRYRARKAAAPKQEVK